MEALTRLVADSLARHGFDRPVDFRRLQWSRWFHCDSQHSLLYVPSKPGVFALAEEIMDFGNANVGTAALGCPAGQSPAELNQEGHDSSRANLGRERHDFTRAIEDSYHGTASAVLPDVHNGTALAAARQKRMLAVTQFFEADDMAFTLDRMLSRPNPLRVRLESGRYFIRFVVIDDQLQRRTVASALNQWIVSAAEKATGLGAQFATSMELTPNSEPAHVGTAASAVQRSEASAVSATTGSATSVPAAPQFSSGAATNIHQPPVFPSGF